MPVNEGPLFDSDTAATMLLVERVRADDSDYRRIAQERAEAQRAAAEAAAAAEARRERMRSIARLKRPGRKHKRPWLDAGYRTRDEWRAAGSPEPPVT